MNVLLKILKNIIKINIENYSLKLEVPTWEKGIFLQKRILLHERKSKKFKSLFMFDQLCRYDFHF